MNNPTEKQFKKCLLLSMILAGFACQGLVNAENIVTEGTPAGREDLSYNPSTQVLTIGEDTPVKIDGKNGVIDVSLVKVVDGIFMEGVVIADKEVTADIITGVTIKDGNGVFIKDGKVEALTVSDGQGVIITGGAVTANTVTDGTATISGGVVSATSFNTTNTISAGGNISGGSFASTGTITANGAVSGSSLFTGGVVSGSSFTDGSATLAGGSLSGLKDATLTGVIKDSDSAVTVDDDLMVNKTLGVLGATTLSSTLNVSSTAALGSTLNVVGATSLASTLDVGGAISNTAGAEVQIDDALTVTGATKLNSGTTSEKNTLIEVSDASGIRLTSKDNSIVITVDSGTTVTGNSNLNGVSNLIGTTQNSTNTIGKVGGSANLMTGLTNTITGATSSVISGANSSLNLVNNSASLSMQNFGGLVITDNTSAVLSGGSAAGNCALTLNGVGAHFSGVGNSECNFETAGDVNIAGTLTVTKNTDLNGAINNIGTTQQSLNNVGTFAGSTNNIGSSTATNTISGTANTITGTTSSAISGANASLNLSNNVANLGVTGGGELKVSNTQIQMRSPNGNSAVTVSNADGTVFTGNGASGGLNGVTATYLNSANSGLTIGATNARLIGGDGSSNAANLILSTGSSSLQSGVDTGNRGLAVNSVKDSSSLSGGSVIAASTLNLNATTADLRTQNSGGLVATDNVNLVLTGGSMASNSILTLDGSGTHITGTGGNAGNFDTTGRATIGGNFAVQNTLGGESVFTVASNTGNTSIAGTMTLAGNADLNGAINNIGTTQQSINNVGTFAGSTNNIGSSSATNTISGTANTITGTTSSAISGANASLNLSNNVANLGVANGSNLVINSNQLQLLSPDGQSLIAVNNAGNTISGLTNKFSGSTYINNDGTGSGDLTSVAPTIIGSRSAGSSTRIFGGNAMLNIGDDSAGLTALSSSSPVMIEGLPYIARNGFTTYSQPMTLPPASNAGALRHDLNNVGDESSRVNIAGVSYVNRIEGNTLINGDTFINGKLSYTSATSASTTVTSGKTKLGEALARAKENGEAIPETRGDINISNQGEIGFVSDNKGKIEIKKLDETTASLTLRNGIGNVHGLVVHEDKLTLSGGAHSTSLILDDNGATFITPESGAPASVHGVADGVQDYDAVNVRQLRSAYAGIAAVAALSAIPMPPAGMNFTLGMGYGYYASEEAIAMGFRGNVSSNISVTAGVSRNTSKKNAANLGMGISW